MSGVPVPQYPIVEPFGADAVNPTDITLPIPIPSQTSVLVGAASFADGFPPATRTDPEAGGVPPYGEDMNGILFMLSAYCALLQAGQRCQWDDPSAYELGGYRVGAELDSASTPGLYWTNWVDGNEVDPDADDTDWSANYPLYSTVAPAAGTYNDVVLPGASDQAIDVDTTAGNITYTGFVFRRPGQKLILSNTGANLLTLDVLTGSAANNQIRGIALTLVQGQTAVLQHIPGLNKWLFV